MIITNFIEYQKACLGTAKYPNLGNNYTYPTLGLCGEAGEVAEKIKKVIRDEDGIISPEKKEELIKELGDVMWYVAMMCHELGIHMVNVANFNIQKLESRKKRGKLQGSGDNR